MKANLIPCPDCGASAEVEQGCYVGMSLTYSYAHCTNPGCHLYRHTLHFTAPTPLESELRAAQSWNERYAGTVPMGQRSTREMPARTRTRGVSMTGLHA